MQKNWWKFLCCVLLIYTLIAGLSIPLAPGIKDVSKLLLERHSTEIDVTGYNTHFLDNKESLQVKFFNDSLQITCAEIISVESNVRIRLKVDFPEKVNSTKFYLYISDQQDGKMSYSGINFKGAAYDKDHVSYENCGSTQEIEIDRVQFPFLNRLWESIRNLLYHVPMWFSMIFIMLISVIYSTKYLGSNNIKDDIKSQSAVSIGLLFAFLGLATGSLWAKFAWGDFWTDDPKLNGSAISTLIYLSYFVLRRSIDDREKKARISSVYNIFAFVMFIVLIMVYPRIHEGLHPGMGGNPAFSSYDLDNNLRLVFYPAVLGFILLAAWIWQIRSRIQILKESDEN